MRGIAILVSSLFAVALAACERSRVSVNEQDFTYWRSERVSPRETRRIEMKTDGQVIDAAGVILPKDVGALDAMASEVGGKLGLQVLILTVPPLGGESLENFGWAINGQRRKGQTLMLMVQPDKRQVRVESGGTLTPAQSAGIAAAMAPQLAQREVAPAILTGLARLSAVGPQRS